MAGTTHYELCFCHLAPRDCGIPAVPRNGKTFGSDFSVGKKVQYICHPGFALEGDDVIECLSNKMWSGRAPKCKGKN